MAKSHFSFKKRQKELARQKKQEEKRQRRLAKKAGDQENEALEVEATDANGALEVPPAASEKPETGPDDPEDT